MSSTSASLSKVFIFGATGKVGSALLSNLTSNELPYHKHFQLTALLRPETLESKEESKSSIVNKIKAAGVTVVTGDATKADVSEIAKWISGYDIVVSTLTVVAPGPSIELKLLEAVKLAKVSWFIPSLYGIDLQRATEFSSAPLLASKKGLPDAVRAAGVNSFYFINYVFMEYLLSPWCGVDVSNGIITAPYSWDHKVSCTSIADVAAVVAEALLQRNEPHVKNQVLRVAGDTLTYLDLANVLDAHYKKSFQRACASKEETLEAVANDKTFQNRGARFRVIIGDQKGVFLEDAQSWNIQHAKHLRVSTVSDYLQRH